MNQTEYNNILKTANAVLRTATPVSIQPQQAAWLNEIQQRLTWAGANPTLWDYPQGTVIANSVATSTPSSVYTFDRDFIARAHLVRVSTTVGATPTCTYALQGSTDQSTWTALQFADYLSPDTAVSTTFVITTATTAIKLIIPAQKYKYFRVNMTANTNVTNTIDVTPL